MTEYRGSYSIPFDVDESILTDLKNELEVNGVPSVSKIGIGITFARSLPYTNSNGLGITAKCIKNSLDTGRFSKLDFSHDQSDIMGTMISLKVYDDTEELIPEKPMRVFGLGALYRNRLNDYNIRVEDLPKWGTSLEALFKDFDFWYKGKIVLKEDANAEWLLHVEDIVEGIPYYWESSRVCIIAGGVDENATVDFNGNALTMNPADKESGILLAVAEHKYPVFDLENNELKKNEKSENVKVGDKMSFKVFETENDYNVAIANAVNSAVNIAVATAKQEVEDNLTNTIITPLKNDLQIVQASLIDKDNQIQDFTGKLQTVEASLVIEKERADKAEGEIQKQVTAQLVITRKQVLATKNYPEDRISKKEEWLGKASQEDFDSFIEEVDALYASATKQLQAKAEQSGYKEVFASLNLTGKTSEDGTDGNESGNQEVKPEPSVFL